MTRDEIVAEIKRGLGYRSDKTDEILTKLRLAQIEFEKGKTLPWFIVNEDQEIILSAGQNTFTLPSNFIREYEDLGFPYLSMSDTDGEVIHVKKVPYDKAYSVYAGADGGSPIVYSLRASSMVFFPAPDVDTTLYWSYYAKQDDLASASENAWTIHAPDLLIGFAGMEIAGDLYDDRAREKFAVKYAAGQASLFKEIVAREDANTYYSLGSGH